MFFVCEKYMYADMAMEHQSTQYSYIYCTAAFQHCRTDNQLWNIGICVSMRVAD